jgi:hypothetical protein
MGVESQRKITTVLASHSLRLPFLWADPFMTPALNHHTSKITSLSSLTTLTSFGFRGEALSSLCALCETVVVTTAAETDGQKSVGMKLEMGRRGEVTKKSVVARQASRCLTITSIHETNVNPLFSAARQQPSQICSHPYPSAARNLSAMLSENLVKP